MPIGVLLGLGAYAAYSLCDALIKALGQGLSVYEVGFFTTLFSVLPVLVTKPGDEPLREMFRMHRPGLVLLRALCGVIATMLVIYTFTTIPLAEAYALLFLSPILVTVVATFVLKESMTPTRWVLLIVGFMGVMLVVRPGFRDLSTGHLAAVASVAFAATAAVVLRVVSPVEKRISIVAVVVSTSLLVNGVLMLGSFTWPDPVQFLILATIGFLGCTGHILMISASKIAPANLLAPAQYSQIVFAIVLGALFFGEYPDALTYLGLAIVVAAGTGSVAPVRARKWFGTYLLWRRRQDEVPDVIGLGGAGALDLDVDSNSERVRL